MVVFWRMWVEGCRGCFEYFWVFVGFVFGNGDVVCLVEKKILGGVVIDVMWVRYFVFIRGNVVLVRVFMKVWFGIVYVVCGV